jgi:hypothetical protein
MSLRIGARTANALVLIWQLRKHAWLRRPRSCSRVPIAVQHEMHIGAAIARVENMIRPNLGAAGHTAAAILSQANPLALHKSVFSEHMCGTGLCSSRYAQGPHSAATGFSLALSVALRSNSDEGSALCPCVGGCAGAGFLAAVRETLGRTRNGRSCAFATFT